MFRYGVVQKLSCVSIAVAAEFEVLCRRSCGMRGQRSDLSHSVTTPLLTRLPVHTGKQATTVKTPTMTGISDEQTL